jgi:RecA-family ATPase
MNVAAAISETPISAAQDALRYAARYVACVAPGERIYALEDAARDLAPHVAAGWLNPATASDRIFEIAELHGLLGEPGSREYEIIHDISLLASQPEHQPEPPADNSPLPSPDDYGTRSAAPDIEEHPTIAFDPITPVSWKGTEAEKQQWLAWARIPRGDLTILSGNGGSGKTEIILQLLIYVVAGLSDWLGCTIESGIALFLSCEEPETNIRDRVERICKHRNVIPHDLANLHLIFPDLNETWLAHAGRDGRLTRAPLLDALEAWIAKNRPALVAIDSIAAVFDGEAIARRQVRSFLAMLRKIAREHDVAIILLDHPSVRGMADGSGTANSVDWRNSVRSMLHLSDPDKDDQDVRELTVTKSNYGRAGEKIMLRWSGLTFSTETPSSSPHRAAAERDVDELFLKLLDRFTAEGREVRDSTGSGYAPAAFEDHPESRGVKSKAFHAAMQRLFAAGKIISIQGKRSKHIERTS